MNTTDLENENDEFDQNEEVEVKLSKKYELRPSNCKIQEDINFGNYKHLFRNIELFKEKDKFDLDSYFFYYFNELVKYSRNIEVAKDKFFNISKIDANKYENILFFNKRSYIDIDYDLYNKFEKERKSHKYNINMSDLNNYRHIHYVTVFKILNDIHIQKYNGYMPEKLMSKETIYYYLNVADLILSKRNIATEISEKYLQNVFINISFNMFLIDIDNLLIKE